MMFSLMRCVPWGCHWKASETAVRALADLLKSTIQVCLLYSVSVVLIHLVLHECVEQSCGGIAAFSGCGNAEDCRGIMFQVCAVCGISSMIFSRLPTR